VVFDVARADRVCNFFETILRHTKGSNDFFTLLKWQEEGLSHVFGTVDDADRRVVRTWYEEVPKKCGKSEMAAGVALYCLDQDGEPGCEVYSAASVKKQARAVFDVAASMVRQSKYLSKKYQIIGSTATIVRRTDPTCFYRAIACDGDSNDGMNPHCVIIDELHRWRGRKAQELWAVLRKSQIARKQPLTFIITTAGIPDESPICWQEHEYVRRVNEGVLPPNPRYYGRIWGAADTDDPGDPDTWRKAIPSLKSNGGFLEEETIREIYDEAKSKGEQELADFCRYHLDIWTGKAKRYIHPNIWANGDAPTKPLIKHADRPCYAGLDLSMNTDLTALVLLFPDPDGTFDVLPFFWMPEEAVRERELKDHVPYRDWIKAGFIETCPGDVIDQGLVKKRLQWAHEIFELREVAYDRAQAAQLSIELERDGFTVIPIPQNFMTLSEPTKALKEYSLTKRFRHGGNPVLKWNVDCMAVKGDGNDNFKPIKPNRATDNKRIDGAVALILAMQRYLLQAQDGPSSWENAATAVM
jgi:phage terminase large subunit-like protein